MKKDLDQLMKKMGIDAIHAEGHANRDADLYYLLNGVNIYAHYIKKRGKPACVVHSPIEREEAQKTGHQLINMNNYDLRRIAEKYQDQRKAGAHFLRLLFDELKVKGNVVFYGSYPVGEGYAYLRQVARLNRHIKIYEGKGRGTGLLTTARRTKDQGEIARIKKVRNSVVRAFNVMLKEVHQCKVKDGFIMRGRNARLSIGDLRNIIRRELFACKTIDSAGMIVAQGRDAGVPHNSGRDRQPVRLGQPVVFDIFPQELDGGYFFDFTRTVCFGYAPRPLKMLYDTVSCAHDYACSLLKVGRKTRDVEQSICEYFESKGHRTFLHTPRTQVGYCHSLGHGIGLNIHENPFFNLLKTNKDRIEPNMVFTIEPGLYYPDQGQGVRIEDVIHVDERGRIVNLTNYPRRLVIPL
ncbi:M24 family metallopeptidase [candidate division WOR-3 bacterium]|nr:M24 family metallopeptidase [candidate division WOR-3 bacterium]